MLSSELEPHFSCIYFRDRFKIFGLLKRLWLLIVDSLVILALPCSSIHRLLFLYE